MNPTMDRAAKRTKVAKRGGCRGAACGPDSSSDGLEVIVCISDSEGEVDAAQSSYESDQAVGNNGSSVIARETLQAMRSLGIEVGSFVMFKYNEACSSAIVPFGSQDERPCVLIGKVMKINTTGHTFRGSGGDDDQERRWDIKIWWHFLPNLSAAMRQFYVSRESYDKYYKQGLEIPPSESAASSILGPNPARYTSFISLQQHVPNSYYNEILSTKVVFIKNTTKISKRWWDKKVVKAHAAYLSSARLKIG
jgi:hypothetical protein